MNFFGGKLKVGLTSRLRIFAASSVALILSRPSLIVGMVCFFLRDFSHKIGVMRTYRTCSNRTKNLTAKFMAEESVV
jgi:hypothetical protein